MVILLELKTGVLFAVVFVLGLIIGAAASPEPSEVVTETVTSTKTVTETLTKTVTVTPSPKPTGFVFKEYKVIVRHSTASLYVSFETDRNVELKIIGPDGVEKDSTIVSPDETGAYLYIGDFMGTPESGTYKLIVMDLWGKVFEQELTFTGYDVEVVDVSFDSRYDELLGYIVEKVFITVRNNGDLPTFLSKGLLVLGEETEELYFFSEPLEPGQEKTISATIYVSGLPKSFTVSLRLFNDKEDEVAEYSFQATL